MAINTYNKDFIRLVGELGINLGLNRSVGQIYGILYMSDEPLSLDTIVEQLRMSKGSVSINIRELERWGAVKKIWVSGSRKDFYSANYDFTSIFYRRIKGRLEKILDNFNSAVADFEKSNSLAKSQKQRLSQIKDMQNVLKEIAVNMPDDISTATITRLVPALSLLKSVFPKKGK